MMIVVLRECDCAVRETREPTLDGLLHASFNSAKKGLLVAAEHARRVNVGRVWRGVVLEVENLLDVLEDRSQVIRLSFPLRELGRQVQLLSLRADQRMEETGEEHDLRPGIVSWIVHRKIHPELEYSSAIEACLYENNAVQQSEVCKGRHQIDSSWGTLLEHLVLHHDVIVLKVLGTVAAKSRHRIAGALHLRSERSDQE
mmetsp:Transcript_13419/g.42781  ORF Transcript_13419/g.42781 Transcript_13419/m.42781 type:complete len:200 (+) Transcript_13419:1661-2260(+)